MVETAFTLSHFILKWFKNEQSWPTHKIAHLIASVARIKRWQLKEDKIWPQLYLKLSKLQHSK